MDQGTKGKAVVFISLCQAAETMVDLGLLTVVVTVVVVEVLVVMVVVVVLLEVEVVRVELVCM